MRVRIMQRASSYVAAAAVIVAVVAGVAWTIGMVPPAVHVSLLREGTYTYKAVPVGAEGPLKRCVVCHSIEPGGALRVAPSLYGIVGAPKARATWYGYSPALKTAGGAWSEENLDAFLASPSGYLPGTTMTIAGISDAKERADIIAALKKTP
jgi:cytochrome c